MCFLWRQPAFCGEQICLEKQNHWKNFWIFVAFLQNHGVLPWAGVSWLKYMWWCELRIFYWDDVASLYWGEIMALGCLCGGCPMISRRHRGGICKHIFSFYSLSSPLLKCFSVKQPRMKYCSLKICDLHKVKPCRLIVDTSSLCFLNTVFSWNTAFFLFFFFFSWVEVYCLCRNQAL